MYDLNWLDARMLRLQRPGRPWSILLRVELADPVDVARVDRALESLNAARPELNVRLDPGLRWVPRTAPLCCEAELDLDAGYDLTAGPPVRVHLTDASSLTVLVNHALVDGVGFLTLVEDLLGALGGAATGARAPVTSEDLTRFIGDERADLFGVRPRLGVVEPPCDEALPTVIDTRHVRLDAVRRRAMVVGTSISGLLLGSTHATLASLATTGRPVAVSVPIDLRRRSTMGSGIGNAVVAVPTITRAGPLSDRTRVALGQLNAGIGDGRLGRRLKAYRVTRPGMPRDRPSRGNPTVFETAVLSNLGTADGDVWAKASTIDFAPPAHSTLAVGVVTLGDELSITVRARADRIVVSTVADRLAAFVGD